MKKSLLLNSCKIHSVISAVVLQCALFCMSSTQIHAQTWSWAKSVNGVDREIARRIAVDPWGNVYAVGDFSTSSVTVGSTTLTSNGGGDIFIIKYSPTGSIIWAKSAGGSGSEGPGGILVDDAGNFYITGPYNSPALTFGSTTLSNSGGSDMFIAKYDSSGNVLWAKKAGGSGSDESRSISTDATGAVYVMGDFFGSAITFGSITLTSAGSADAFIVKYDSAGSVIWAKSIGGSSSDYGWCIKSTNNGFLVVSGIFASSPLTIGSTTLTNSGGDDIFIAKLDTSGTALWAKKAGGALADTPRGISTDGQGYIYLGGFYNSPNITFSPFTLPTGGPTDMFLVKYDPSGNVVWAKRAGSSGGEFANGIITDAAGNTTIAGAFGSSSFPLGSTTLVNSGSGATEDIFVAQYDSSGNVLWAKSAGGSIGDYIYSVCTDAAGSVYIAGFYESSTCIIGTTALNNAGFFDAFVAKIGSVPTGINYPQNSGSTIIYPNPAKDKLIIEWNRKNQNGKVTIFDMAGKTVYNNNSIQDKMEIDIDFLPSGVYVVNLQTEEYSETKKLIVTE